MAKKAETRFKKEDALVACPVAMAKPNVASQLRNHTKLSEEELLKGPLYVQAVWGNQLKVKHTNLSEAFTIHSKFLTHAPVQVAQSTA